MKNLSEGFQELLSGFKKSVLDIDDVLKSPIKIKRTSILDDDDTDGDFTEVGTGEILDDPKFPAKFVQEVPQSVVVDIHPAQIKIPVPISDQYQQAVVEQIKAADKIQEIKKIAELRAKKKNKTKTIEDGGELTAEQIEEKMKAVKKEIEILRAEPLPENINIIKLEEEVDTALSDIPGAEDFDIIDVDIQASKTKKDKSGYFKTKVTFKTNEIPPQIAAIASYVKNRTKGLIFPRKCDLRVIANTNKTQLKGSSLKLTTATVVFKPDFTKMKVNKGTRFMLSVPLNYAETGNIIIFLQESRNKKVIEFSPDDLQTGDSFNAFIGDRIAEYFFSGYDVTIKKLAIRSVNNPIMKLVTDIIGTQEYKAKPYIDDNNHVYKVDFISKGAKNQWLIIQAVETDIPNLFNIVAKNTVDTGWEYLISQKPVTVIQMTRNLQEVLETCFNRNWDKELNLDEEDKVYYLYDKLKHGKLKRLLLLLMENNEGEENYADTIGLVVKEVLSKKDTAKALNTDYDAETIIGKTKYVDYFMFTYLAYPIVGGDKRKGQEYITTEEYYEKYNVKDKRPYQEREATILKKEGAKRNYNSRIYMFQLEYSVGKKKHIYRNTNFDVLLEDTGILTKSVKFPTTKF